MATSKIKIIGPKPEEVKHTHRDNWEVMKPFVHFAFGAMKVIAIGLIGIVKAALPLLKPHDNKTTDIKRRH